jgi:hypothetical protein
MDRERKFYIVAFVTMAIVCVLAAGTTYRTKLLSEQWALEAAASAREAASWRLMCTARERVFNDIVDKLTEERKVCHSMLPIEQRRSLEARQ